MLHRIELLARNSEIRADGGFEGLTEVGLTGDIYSIDIPNTRATAVELDSLLDFFDKESAPLCRIPPHPRDRECVRPGVPLKIDDVPAMLLTIRNSVAAPRGGRDSSGED